MVCFPSNTQPAVGEAKLAAGLRERLMENPIWFSFGKLEGYEGSRICCLACVQTADCFSLGLGTQHFCSQLLGFVTAETGGLPDRDGCVVRASFFVFCSAHSPEVPFLTGQLEASVELPLG